MNISLRDLLEAGVADEDAAVDIAFVEGSISTAEEIERIHKVRANSGMVVTLGACATSGGLQALRNLDDNNEAWKHAIYAQPEFSGHGHQGQVYRQPAAVDAVDRQDNVGRKLLEFQRDPECRKRLEGGLWD